MPGPFFRGFDSRDGMVLALGVQSAYNGNRAQAINAVSSVETATSVTLYPGTDTQPPSAVVITPSYIFVFLAGTSNFLQVALDVLGSLQGPYTGVVGSVDQYFGDLGNEFYGAQQALVGENVAGRSVVIAGHSSGGAAAQVWLNFFLQDYMSTPVVCWTFGAPRVGDPVFAAYVSDYVLRYEDRNDPIPSVPPVIWGSTGSVFPMSGPPPLATYLSAGTASTLEPDGGITPGSFPLTAINAAVLMYADQFVSHQLSTYIERLQIGLPIDVFENPIPGFADPPLAQFALESLFPELGVPLVTANYRVTLFYNMVAPQSQKPEAGIIEEFYCISDPTTIRNTIVPAYLGARMDLATEDFTFAYGRISNIPANRIADFISPTDPGITPNGVFPVGLTNGINTPYYDSALLFRMKLAGGPSAKYFFHAYPVNVVRAGKYQPAVVVGFDTAVLKFAALMANTTGGVQHAYMTYATPKPYPQITAFAPAMTRGFTITLSAALTVLPGQVVSILGGGAQMVGLRGRKIVIAQPSPTTIQLGGATPVGTYIPSSATCALLTQNFAYASYSRIERPTKHKVGKPFAQEVGRAKNQLALRR